MIATPPRNRRLLLIGVPLLLIVGLMAWWNLGRSRGEKKVQAPVPVLVVAVELRDVPHWASGIGSVQSLHSVTLRPQVDGVLAEILFREGQTVRKGQLLARIDDRGYAAALLQAQAAKTRTEAQLKSAELDLARYSNLLAEEAISRQTVEQQTATVDQLKAELRAGEAAIATAQVQLSYTRISSPLDGRVGLRRVDAGNLVQAGDSGGLVTVTQLNPISVVFTLPQEQLSRVRHLLDDAAAPVTAYDRDAGTALAQGRLSMIDNQIDPATGMVRLRAEFANADGSLWPGQFVTVRLQTGVSGGALVLPVRALRQGLKGAYVFVVREGAAKVVPVVASYQDDQIAVISKGVAAGDSIVTDGYSRLKDGSMIEVITAPASVAGTAAGH